LVGDAPQIVMKLRDVCSGHIDDPQTSECREDEPL
jgi:hypothetical protein